MTTEPGRPAAQNEPDPGDSRLTAPRRSGAPGPGPTRSDPTGAGAAGERRPTGGIRPDSATKPLLDLSNEARLGWLQRRREKMVAEIQRNRRGEYSVPTWILVAVLVVIVAAWAALIIFG